MGLLNNGMPVGIRIVDASELQIAIDFTHEPWRSLAQNILRKFIEEMGELDLKLENQDLLLDIINEAKGDLQ